MPENPAKHSADNPAGAAPDNKKRYGGARLVVEFARVSANDRPGLVNIECTHPEPWIYHCIGSHHGAQVSRPGDEAAVLGLGAGIAALLQKHFADLPGPSVAVNPPQRPVVSRALQRSLAARLDPQAVPTVLPNLVEAVASLQADPTDRMALASAVAMLMVHAEHQGADLLGLAAQVAWEELEDEADGIEEGGGDESL